MMDTTIRTTRQLPKKLKQTLEELLKIVPADFVFNHDNCLYIVPGMAAFESMHDYKTNLEGADWNHSGHTWALYDMDEIEKGIEAGKVFYNVVFTTARLIYDSGYTALPIPLPLRVQHTGQHGKAVFEFGCSRSGAFYKSAQALTAPEDAGVAAFMIHQSIELLLRAFIIAVTGQEVKSHTLSDLMRHVLRFAPGLQTTRTATGKPLHRLPDRLEKAYTGGRYSLQFQVAPALLPELFNHVAQLREAVKKAFDNMIDAYLVPTHNLISTQAVKHAL